MLENTFLITFFINFDFTSLFLLIVCFFFFITVLLGTKETIEESYLYRDITLLTE